MNFGRKKYNRFSSKDWYKTFCRLIRLHIYLNKMPEFRTHRSIISSKVLLLVIINFEISKFPMKIHLKRIVFLGMRWKNIGKYARYQWMNTEWCLAFNAFVRTKSKPRARWTPATVNVKRVCVAFISPFGMRRMRWWLLMTMISSKFHPTNQTSHRNTCRIEQSAHPNAEWMMFCLFIHIAVRFSLVNGNAFDGTIEWSVYLQ